MATTPFLAIVRKDIHLALRQSHNLYGILVYCASTIFVLYLTAGHPEPEQWNALFWITQLFIVVNAVVKSFVGEPPGRFIYYHSVASPLHYLFGKFLINVFYMTVLGIVSGMLFRFLLGNPVHNTLVFMGIVWLGGTGFALLFTMLSAIASKARQQASLLAILGFPLIIPQLLLVARLSKFAYGEIFRDGALWQITGLLAALDILIVVMASILFPYLWKD